jgi:hypothetical protein
MSATIDTVYQARLKRDWALRSKQIKASKWGQRKNIKTLTDYLFARSRVRAETYRLRELGLAVIAQAFADLKNQPQRTLRTPRNQEPFWTEDDSDQRDAARFLAGCQSLDDWAAIAKVSASGVTKRAWATHGDLMARYTGLTHAA